MSESRFDSIADISIYCDEMHDMIKEYLRDDEMEDGEIDRYWKTAVGYLERYTGADREKLRTYPELVQALLALCEEYHDNRSFSTNGEPNYINKMIDSLMKLHRGNLIK
ncbi:MAG: phage gp6-like head-tail connector protein [Firmicutes bacterium]|nr:phage gp6-like head-tail connector protein [Bacillota bacterium]